MRNEGTVAEKRPVSGVSGGGGEGAQEKREIGDEK
jgi:hypothetical protein